MSILSRLIAGASSLALLAFSGAAHADDGPDKSTIIVTGRRATGEARQQIDKRPGGVDVVDASAFDDKMAVSLRDALAFSPGVYVQPRFGQEVRLSIRGSGISRGYHMRGLTLLMDGVPINLADDNGDFQELNPQVFERIEVYRGANALRFGGSTLGGAINAVTPTGRTAPQLDLRVDGGSFSTVRGKMAAGHADERGDAFVALTADRSDGDRAHAERDALRMGGNIGLRLSDNAQTRFYATLSQIDQRLPGSLTLGQALSTPRLSLPANITRDQQRNMDSIRLQNRTSVELGAGTATFGAFFNAKQLFHPIFQVLDHKSEDSGVFASIDVGGDLGDLPWELTLGSQARFGTVAARQFVNAGGERGSLTADARQTARTVTSYGELRVRPFERFTLLAGGIYISGERKIDNKLAPARSGRAGFDAFAPKFGVLFEPVDAVQIYANYSRSVELPGFSELSQTPASGLPGFTPVGSQKAWTFELGTRGASGIAAWDITAYRSEVEGEMLQFAIAADIPAATFNAGRTRHQGIEAGLDLQPWPWLRLRQVYQLNDFRFRGDRQFGDNRLPVVPKHHYRAELRLGTERLSITPNIEWVPRGAWADYRNTMRVPGYTLLGLGAEARVRDGISFFIDARNLTGKKAIGDISAIVDYVPDDPASAADESTVAFYPVERRAFYCGLRARF